MYSIPNQKSYMRKIFIIAAILLLLLIPTSLKAQEGSAILGVRAGYSAPFGGFSSISVEADHSFRQNFSLSGGVQYNSIGKTALEVRPSYFHDFDGGRLSAEVLMHRTYISSISNSAIGAGVGFKGQFLYVRAGYYYRVYGSENSQIKEPFNIYYEFGVTCLPGVPKWDLDLSITNCEIFELERHYQLSYIAEVRHYPFDDIGITLGVSYKPAGMFNMSTDSYRFSSKLGVSYRW